MDKKNNSLLYSEEEYAGYAKFLEWCRQKTKLIQPYKTLTKKELLSSLTYMTWSSDSESESLALYKELFQKVFEKYRVISAEYEKLLPAPPNKLIGLDLLDKKHLSEIKRMAEKAKSHEKQSRGIVDTQEERKLKKKIMCNEARKRADILLGNNVNPRKIVGSIARKTKWNSRTIRRYLKEHPSGHWK